MTRGKGAAKDADWIRRAAEEEGVPLDTIEIVEKPHLDDWLYGIYSIFCAVSRSRTFGMGGAMPADLPSIVAAFKIFSVLDDDMPDWLFLIQELDAKWLALSMPKTETEKAEA